MRVRCISGRGSAHGTMGHWIDPSWWTIELFLDIKTIIPVKIANFLRPQIAEVYRTNKVQLASVDCRMK